MDGTEGVRNIKYLGTVISNTNDETVVVKTRILAGNKTYSSLQTVFRSKQIHSNNKIIQNINSASTLLWKRNLDPNTNDNTNAMYV